MPSYVLGFLFDEDFENVVLIQKQKPEWQKGKFNGIGGKIEPGEGAYKAMTREFKEETGLLVEDWILTGFLSGDDYNPFIVELFAAALPKQKVLEVKTMETEEVFVFPLDKLPEGLLLSNLKWLIPYNINALNSNSRLDLHVKYGTITDE